MHIKKGNGAIDRNGWTPLRVAVHLQTGSQMLLREAVAVT
jgi:hypothetical protein